MILLNINFHESFQNILSQKCKYTQINYMYWFSILKVTIFSFNSFIMSNYYYYDDDSRVQSFEAIKNMLVSNNQKENERNFCFRFFKKKYEKIIVDENQWGISGYL